MNTEEKIKKINELLELKEVTIQDDYFTDIFVDSDGKRIFSVMSSRGFEKYPEKEEEVLNEIITNLDKYEKNGTPNLERSEGIRIE